MLSSTSMLTRIHKPIDTPAQPWEALLYCSLVKYTSAQAMLTDEFSNAKKALLKQVEGAMDMAAGSNEYTEIVQDVSECN
jgi:hypothetical protein